MRSITGFHSSEFRGSLERWGRGLPKCLASFYTEKSCHGSCLRFHFHPPKPTRRGGCMRQFSAAQSVAAIFAVLILSFLVSCSGTNSSANPVTSITLTPNYLSLSPGQTFQLAAQPKDYAGNNVVADVSYSSSNTNLVTVTATGIVCAGLWDPNFITCNAIKGQAAVGQASITVTSGSVTAAAITYTHLQVDRIFVTPPTGCVSMGATPTYLATVYNITAPGCSPNIPCDIT